MNILNGFDEMRLAQDEIDGFGFFNCDSLNVHKDASWFLWFSDHLLLAFERLFLYSIFNEC